MYFLKRFLGYSARGCLARARIMLRYLGGVIYHISNGAEHLGRVFPYQALIWHRSECWPPHTKTKKILLASILEEKSSVLVY